LEMKTKVLEEIEKLRNTGKIDDNTYRKLKKVVENPIEIDLGKIFEKYGVSSNDLVLDIAAGGSGTGPKILGKNVIALDVSKEEIFSAIKEGAFAQWICADARNLPFRNDLLDFVITFVGLAYINGNKDKFAVLKEAYRVLKENGLILLIEPEIVDCQDYMKYFVIHKDGIKINETILGVSGTNIAQSLELLTNFLKNVGFEVNAEKTDDLLIIVGRVKFSR